MSDPKVNILNGTRTDLQRAVASGRGGPSGVMEERDKPGVDSSALAPLPWELAVTKDACGTVCEDSEAGMVGFPFTSRGKAGSAHSGDQRPSPGHQTLAGRETAWTTGGCPVEI